MSEYDDALLLAIRAHHGQTRKNTGDPYIVHPVRVAKIASERVWKEDRGWGYERVERLRMAAVLHDVVEDTDVRAEQIAFECGPDIAAIVDLLSRPEGLSYYEFIQKIDLSDNEVAIRIKLADLEDNLSDLPQDHGLRARYEKAQTRLEGALKGLTNG